MATLWQQPMKLQLCLKSLLCLFSVSILGQISFQLDSHLLKLLGRTLNKDPVGRVNTRKLKDPGLILALPKCFLYLLRYKVKVMGKFFFSKLVRCHLTQKKITLTMLPGAWVIAGLSTGRKRPILLR